MDAGGAEAREARLGLLDLLLLPVTGPVRGLAALLQELAALAEREAADEGRLRERLLELQLGYELGEVDEDAYRRGWRELGARWLPEEGEER